MSQCGGADIDAGSWLEQRATQPAGALKPAIGRTADGHFSTSALKECPAAFAEAIADGIADFPQEKLLMGRLRPQEAPEPSLREWVKLADRATSTIREDATWLPDLQPQLARAAR